MDGITALVCIAALVDETAISFPFSAPMITDNPASRTGTPFIEIRNEFCRRFPTLLAPAGVTAAFRCQPSEVKASIAASWAACATVIGLFRSDNSISGELELRVAMRQLSERCSPKRNGLNPATACRALNTGWWDTGCWAIQTLLGITTECRRRTRTNAFQNLKSGDMIF